MKRYRSALHEAVELRRIARRKELSAIRPFIKSLRNDENDEYINKIYSLTCPISRKIFYIGCTVSKMRDRIYQHYYENTNQDKLSILNDLMAIGQFPVVEVLYKIKSREKARCVEKYLTHFLINNDKRIDLVNAAGRINISENVYSESRKKN